MVREKDGVRRLLGLLQPLAGRFDVRLCAVVPEALDHDAFWTRVKARDARTHIGLAISDKLSEKKAYKIFKDLFIEPCERFLPMAQKCPGAIVTDAFTAKLPAGFSGNPLGATVAQLAEQLAAVGGAESGDPDDATCCAALDAVGDWLDQVPGAPGGHSLKGV